MLCGIRLANIFNSLSNQYQLPLYSLPKILHALSLYHKQQKLSEGKVLRFTEFHANVGKTFAVLIHVY